jgi:quinol monooxygenase YgiN
MTTLTLAICADRATAARPTRTKKEAVGGTLMDETTRIVGATGDVGQTSNMPREPFVAVISIHVKPDSVDEFLRILSRVADAVRCEPTLISNVAHLDPEDETKFMLWEMWSDQRDFFEVQMLREYRKPYESRLPHLLAEPREVRIWQPLRGHVTFSIPDVIKNGRA